VNSWKVILATMVIFGTGVITGSLLVRRAAPVPRNPPSVAVPHPPQNVSAGGMRIEFLRRMERELDLTARQHAQVDKLLKESQERSRKIMEPVAPQMMEELERTKEQFRAALTPGQQARFDQLLKQQRPHEKTRTGPSHERPTESSNGFSPSGEIERRP
jgi:Spy/CpxP family protein refolding chaperone